MFKATLDRIEDQNAVLLVREDESKMLFVPLSLLPSGIGEGDILEIEIRQDILGTEQARERVVSLLDRLKNKKH
ncbi:Protein of unknown function (DUF3006) (plasmid) [Methanomethylovorans hollandica DSM 15978]|jgi:hypothetical protein|uniref:DUF3006 domain-containing protein n=1 Tax=Methanomethylovorans hollandica (strain DSM 15978 / NBRC 107637 / DMS1) TaxID=867904 RepID=L0L149_METHD|nr:DUF3006 domain-containing protein [Methanomethylovorans hollandica]AGB50675.1 Protein of unknown function (DUF3006) [Methanomethylovorans hollandica DSM 15978]